MTTTTSTRLPKGLQVSLSDIEHGLAITATAQVSWPPIGETGGPLTLAFWADSLVMYTPSGSGSHHDLRFYLRGVAYNVRAEYQRQADGTWQLSPGHIDRAEWTSLREMHASDAARRDIRAVLAEVGRQIVEARPDLFESAELARLRGNLQAATATVERLEKDLAEARQAKRTAEIALTLGEAALLRATGAAN